MKITILLLLAGCIFCGCKKDKYSTTPQIQYRSLSPNFSNNDVMSIAPIVTLSLTDAEGDVGITIKDTARIFIKNLLTGKFDSLDFPDLKDVGKNSFKADLLLSVSKGLDCRTIPGGLLHIDTLYYEIFVQDFARNKSNTIVTGEPTFYECR